MRKHVRGWGKNIWKDAIFNYGVWRDLMEDRAVAAAMIVSRIEIAEYWPSLGST